MKWSMGYTLIELMLAFLLCIIILTLAMHHISGTHAQDALRQEITLFMLTCSQCQQLALATGQEQQLLINSKDHNYTFCSLRGLPIMHKLPSAMTFGVPENSYGPPAAPTHLITVPCSFEKKADRFVLRFFPQGNMSSGTLYIVHRSGACVALSNAVSEFATLRLYQLDKGIWKEIVEQQNFMY